MEESGETDREVSAFVERSEPARATVAKQGFFIHLQLASALPVLCLILSELMVSRPGDHETTAQLAAAYSCLQ